MREEGMKNGREEGRKEGREKEKERSVEDKTVWMNFKLNHTFKKNCLQTTAGRLLTLPNPISFSFS